MDISFRLNECWEKDHALLEAREFQASRRQSGEHPATYIGKLVSLWNSAQKCGIIGTEAIMKVVHNIPPRWENWTRMQAEKYIYITPGGDFFAFASKLVGELAHSDHPAVFSNLEEEIEDAMHINSPPSGWIRGKEKAKEKHVAKYECSRGKEKAKEKHVANLEDTYSPIREHWANMSFSREGTKHECGYETDVEDYITRSLIPVINLVTPPGSQVKRRRQRRSIPIKMHQSG